MQESGIRSRSYPELQAFPLNFFLLISTYDIYYEYPDYLPHNQTQYNIYHHLSSLNLILHPIIPDYSPCSQRLIYHQRKVDQPISRNEAQHRCLLSINTSCHSSSSSVILLLSNFKTLKLLSETFNPSQFRKKSIY